MWDKGITYGDRGIVGTTTTLYLLKVLILLRIITIFFMCIFGYNVSTATYVALRPYLYVLTIQSINKKNAFMHQQWIINKCKIYT